MAGAAWGGSGRPHFLLTESAHTNPSLPKGGCPDRSRGALGHVCPCLCAAHSARANKRAVFSAEPPLSYINAALFRQLGWSFLFHFAVQTPFLFLPWCLQKSVVHLLIAHGTCLLCLPWKPPGLRICTALGEDRDVTSESRFPPATAYSEFSLICLPTSLVFFPNADWISSAQVKRCLLELSQSG